jgi:hypothetical protein
VALQGSTTCSSVECMLSFWICLVSADDIVFSSEWYLLLKDLVSSKAGGRACSGLTWLWSGVYG